MLMAEIERGEHDDEGAARAWTLRAVRAALDPVWTADGFVSDRWRPVSPVTGRLDAFQWMVPVAALPSSGPTAEMERAAMIPAPKPPKLPAQDVAPVVEASTAAPTAAPAEIAPVQEAITPAAPPPPPVVETPVPVFRPRVVSGSTVRPVAPAIPAVIPIVRAPDDPGVDGAEDTEFADRSDPATAQAGGVRGFLSRLVR